MSPNQVPSGISKFEKRYMPKKSTYSPQIWWKWYWRIDARKGIWEVWNGLNWMQPRLRLITGGTIKKAICIQLHQPKLTSISSTQQPLFLHQIFTIISATSSIFSSQSYKNVVNPILKIFQQVFHQLNHTSFYQPNLTSISSIWCSVFNLFSQSHCKIYNILIELHFRVFCSKIDFLFIYCCKSRTGHSAPWQWPVVCNLVRQDANNRE